MQYLPEGQAPEAGVRTYGFGNQKVSLGNFHNDAYGDYIRYTYDSCGSLSAAASWRTAACWY